MADTSVPDAVDEISVQRDPITAAMFPDIDKDVVDKFLGAHRIGDIGRRAGTQIGKIGVIQGGERRFAAPIKSIDNFVPYRFHKRSESAWGSPDKNTQTK